jgi:hypothetical protein
MPKSLLLKQQEAKERQSERNKRSPKDQISHLDSIFGKDLGAKKEREKLLALIKKQSEKPEKVEKVEKVEKSEKTEKKTKKKSKAK